MEIGLRATNVGYDTGMTTRVVFIGAGVLLLCAAGVGIFLFMRMTADSPTSEGLTPSPFGFFDSANETPLTKQEPTSQTGAEPANEVSENTVVDFRNDGITIADPSNPGVYIVAGGEDPTGLGAPYSIIYTEEDQLFTITLLKEPIVETRKAMEEELMRRLNSSENLMCRLNYWVGVPYSYNEFYAGRNLGFSFCPGAVTI